MDLGLLQTDIYFTDSFLRVSLLIPNECISSSEHLLTKYTTSLDLSLSLREQQFFLHMYCNIVKRWCDTSSNSL